MCETDSQREAAVIAQGAQPGALWCPRAVMGGGVEGGSRGRGYVYSYS